MDMNMYYEYYMKTVLLEIRDEVKKESKEVFKSFLLHKW